METEQRKATLKKGDDNTEYLPSKEQRILQDERQKMQWENNMNNYSNWSGKKV